MTILPRRIQFFIDEALTVIFELLCIIGYGLDNFIFNKFCLYIGIGVAICLIYKYYHFKTIKYIVTQDQIIYIHGLFCTSTEYIELYRVVDYKQRQSFLQRLAQIKTVVIYSGDKSMPILNMMGINVNVDLVKSIRNYVELSKSKRGVYEITNRN